MKGAGCCWTTAMSSSTSSTRKSGTTTAWNGCGATRKSLMLTLVNRFLILEDAGFGQTFCPYRTAYEREQYAAPSAAASRGRDRLVPAGGSRCRQRRNSPGRWDGERQAPRVAVSVRPR